MRPIKLRAWDGERWRTDFTIDSDGSVRLTNYCGDGEPGTVVIWDTVQFTGLLDKNGVEIYDGDIIKTEYVNSERVWDIKYHIGHNFSGFGFIENLNTSEVIGNIYENPELLKSN